MSTTVSCECDSIMKYSSVKEKRKSSYVILAFPCSCWCMTSFSRFPAGADVWRHSRVSLELLMHDVILAFSCSCRGMTSFSRFPAVADVWRHSRVSLQLLMCAKVAASVLSGSFSIISSLIENVLDLLAGVFMWWAARAIRHRDLYKYPQGNSNAVIPTDQVICMHIE